MAQPSASAQDLRDRDPLDQGSWWNQGEKVMVGKLGNNGRISPPLSTGSGGYSNMASRGVSEAPRSLAVSQASSVVNDAPPAVRPAVPGVRSPAEVTQVHNTLSDSVQQLEDELKDIRRRWGGDRDPPAAPPSDVPARGVTPPPQVVSSGPRPESVIIQQTNENMSSLLDELHHLSQNFSVTSQKYEAQISTLSEDNASLAARNAALIVSSAVTEASVKAATERVVAEVEENAAMMGPQTASCQHHLKELEEMHRNYKDELESARQKYEYAIAAKDLLKAEVEELQKQVVNASANNPSSEVDLRTARDEIARLERRVASETSEKVAIEDRLKIELADTRKQLAAAKEFGEEKMAELLQAKFTIAKLTDDVHVWRSNVDAAQDQIKLEKERSENSQQNNAKLTGLVASLEERLAKEKAEKLQLNELAAVDKAELLKYRSDYKAMQKVVTSERDQLRQEVEDLTSLLTRHMNHQDSESLAQFQLIKDLDNAKKENEDLKTQITLLQQGETKLQREKLELQEGVASRIREVEAEKQHVLLHAEEIQNSVQTWRKEKETLVFEREAKVRAIGEIKAERDSLLLELDKLRKDNDFLNGEIEGFRERSAALDRFEKEEVSRTNLLQQKLRNANAEREGLMAEMQQLRETLSQVKEDAQRTQGLMRKRFATEVEQMKEELNRERNTYLRNTNRAETRVEELKSMVYKQLPATEDEVRDLKRLLDEERDNLRHTRDQLARLEGENARLLERDAQNEMELRRLRNMEHDREQDSIRKDEGHSRDMLALRRALTQTEDRMHDMELTMNELRSDKRRLDDLQQENDDLRQEVRVLKDKRIFQMKSGKGLGPLNTGRNQHERGQDWGPVQLASTLDEWVDMENGNYDPQRARQREAWADRLDETRPRPRPGPNSTRW